MDSNKGTQKEATKEKPFQKKAWETERLALITVRPKVKRGRLRGTNDKKSQTQQRKISKYSLFF